MRVRVPTSRPPARSRGSALSVFVALASVLSIVTLTTVVAHHNDTTASLFQGATVPDDLIVAAAVTQTGVTPEALTVAGLSLTEAGVVIDRVVADVVSRMDELRASIQSIEAARGALQLAEQDTSSTDAQLNSLRQTLEDADNTHRQMISAVQASALSSLSEPQRRRFDNYRSNSARYTGLHPQLAASTLSPEEATRLAAICRRLSTAQARGESDPDAQSQYSAALAEPDAAEAADRFEERLEAIQLAFNNAIDVSD